MFRFDIHSPTPSRERSHSRTMNDISNLKSIIMDRRFMNEQRNNHWMHNLSFVNVNGICFRLRLLQGYLKRKQPYPVSQNGWRSMNGSFCSVFLFLLFEVALCVFSHRRSHRRRHSIWDRQSIRLAIIFIFFFSCLYRN